MKANSNFVCMEPPNEDIGINVCDLCGREVLCQSMVVLQANFGSPYDGESYTLDVCGDCMDGLINKLGVNSNEFTV